MSSDNVPIMCVPIAKASRDEKEALWSDFLGALVKLVPLRNGYRLQFRLSPSLLNNVGRLISLERSCCQFLRFRLDVPPVGDRAVETMDVDIVGGRGAKAVLKTALENLGFHVPAVHGHWLLKAGLFGVVFGLLCCVAPLVLSLLGLYSLATLIGVLDGVAFPVMGISAVLLAVGVVLKLRRTYQCGECR